MIAPYTREEIVRAVASRSEWITMQYSRCPLISVIIPAYNAERWLGGAITSALAQTWRDLEVIVVDDGSNDGTVGVVQEFSDARLVLVRQANLGQSAALNRGVAESRGEFIKLLDADDWLNPGHLAAMISVLGDGGNEVAACGWGYFVDDPRLVTVRAEHVNHDYSEPLEWLVDSLTRDEGMMGGWKWLIPREVWNKAGGYDARLNLNNDFHFSIKLLLASEGVRFAEGAVYSYRKGISAALSASKGRTSMESAFLTTKLGTDLLLERENSERIHRICADRFQSWLFQFFPFYPDLVAETEKRIYELGGSDLELQGGQILRMLLPVIGWKGVRRLQCFAYKYGWERILKKKAAKRLSLLD